MKRFLLAIALILPTSVLFAQAEVVLSINHQFGTSDYVHNAEVTTPGGYPMKVTRLEYYMSGFTLTHDGGQVTALDGVHILVDAANPEPYSLGQVDGVTDLEGISFSIGVEEAYNHLDPATYDPSHPLAPQLPSMHWGWAAGYRFLAFEGQSGQNLNIPFEIHALGDDNYMGQDHDVSASVAGNELNINIDADYFELINNVDVSSGVIVHGETGIAVTSLLNMRSLVFSGAAPVSVGENLPFGFQFYPNPAEDVIVISPESSHEAYELILRDARGQAVMQLNAETGQRRLDVSQLPVGMYFLEIRSGEQSAVEKLVIR